MTPAELGAFLERVEGYIAEADEAELLALIAALEAALVARVHPNTAGLMRAAVHGIRLTLIRSRAHEARTG